MAFGDLHQFLLALSRHPSLRQSFASDSATADRLMTEANLSDQEKKLLRDGDEQAIRKYLGDEFSKAIMIVLKP
jgi:hypothetical protein